MSFSTGGCLDKPYRSQYCYASVEMWHQISGLSSRVCGCFTVRIATAAPQPLVLAGATTAVAIAIEY